MTIRQFFYYKLSPAIVFIIAFNLYPTPFSASNKAFPVWYNNTNQLDSTTAQDILSSSQYCPKDLAGSLSALTFNLLTDPQNGLRPLNLTILTPPTEEAEKEILFSGLDITVFRNKRIIFVGDSTGRYLFGWLQVLIHDNLCEKYNSSVLEEVQRMSLSDANHHLLTKAELCKINLNSTRAPGLIHPSDNTTIKWTGFGGNPRGRDNKLIRKAWKGAKRAKPQILIVNHGMHWLHFMNLSRDIEEVAILRWIFYEQWLDEVVENALLMNETVEVLLFKTTNLICTDKMSIIYRDAQKVYYLARNKTNSTLYADNDTVKNCQREVENILIERHDVTQDQILEFCLYGTFDEIGSEYLNRRLYHYVINLLSSSSKYKNLPFQVGIFNDHAVESCAYTGINDGRHYQWLILARLRLLANILSCINEWSDNQKWKEYAEFLLHKSTSDFDTFPMNEH